MSRIHEALKKAEQEREMSQAAGRPEAPMGSILESAPGADAVMAAASARAGSVSMSTQHLSQDNPLTRSRKVEWRPDPKKMLFFNSQEEHAAGMEEFRTLRSRLYQAREKRPLTKVLVTSALPKEGKSFTSANMAQVLVRQHGKRALLIDADLRNPQLHNLLGAEPGPGLFEYLRSEADEGSIMQSGPMENFYFIPAGKNLGNPAELVANGRMKTLLSRLEPLFDWIIIDSPPSVPVTDAGVIANYCDGVVLVVRSNNTPVDAARRARKEFADHNVIGVVLNGISPDSAPYAQYYYGSYGASAAAGN